MLARTKRAFAMGALLISQVFGNIANSAAVTDSSINPAHNTPDLQKLAGGGKMAANEFNDLNRIARKGTFPVPDRGKLYTPALNDPEFIRAMNSFDPRLNAAIRNQDRISDVQFRRGERDMKTGILLAAPMSERKEILWRSMDLPGDNSGMHVLIMREEIRDEATLKRAQAQGIINPAVPWVGQGKYMTRGLIVYNGRVETGKDCEVIHFDPNAYLTDPNNQYREDFSNGRIDVYHALLGKAPQERQAILGRVFSPTMVGLSEDPRRNVFEAPYKADTLDLNKGTLTPGVAPSPYAPGKTVSSAPQQSGMVDTSSLGATGGTTNIQPSRIKGGPDFNPDGMR